MAQQRAFVTGATGLLGSNLSEQLRAAGAEVTVLVRSEQRGRALLGELPARYVVGDLENVAAFAGALAGHDVLYHCAAYFTASYNGGDHRAALNRVNVDGSRALVEAAYAAGIRRVVHVSSSSKILGGTSAAEAADESSLRSPQTEPVDYTRSKMLTDAAVGDVARQRPDLEIVTILPGWMWGPGDAAPTTAGKLILDFVRRKFPAIPEAEFTPVDVRDVAHLIVLAAERGRAGDSYLLALPAPLTMREIATVLERVTGIPAPKRDVPLGVIGALATVEEVTSRLTRRPAQIGWQAYQLMRTRRGHEFYSSAKAIREFDISLRPFETTVRDAVNWFSERGLITLDGSAPARPRGVEATTATP